MKFDTILYVDEFTRLNVIQTVFMYLMYPL